MIGEGERTGVDEGALWRRAGEVFGYLEGLIRGLPVPAGHRELLLVHLEEGRAQAAESPGGLSCAQLPLLVHAAIAGDEEPALPVAGACTLLYLGADLFDNLADEELPDRWLPYHPSQANLAAATYLAALPQLSLARLVEREVPPQKVWSLSRLFAETLLTMSAGQHEDLVSDGGMSAADCRALSEKKSGAEIGLFARAGAVLATDDGRLHEAYARMGASIGTAGQIASDLYDIWEPGASQDLLNGKRPLPVVHALTRLRGEPRGRLLALLAAARESPEPHAAVRELLAQAGSLRYAALIVEVYRHQALARLAEAAPRDPAGGELEALLEETTLLPAEKQTAPHGAGAREG